MDEKQTISETGGKKGTKTADFSQLPPDVMWELAEHFGKGEAKYGRDNWRKGYEWSKNVAALGRHLALWQMGEDYDDETGSHHLNAVIWHAVVLRYFSMHPEYEKYNDVQPTYIDRLDRLHEDVVVEESDVIEQIKKDTGITERLAAVYMHPTTYRQSHQTTVFDFCDTMRVGKPELVDEVDPPNEPWRLYASKAPGTYIYTDYRGGVHIAPGPWVEAEKIMTQHRARVDKSGKVADNGAW